MSRVGAWQMSEEVSARFKIDRDTHNAHKTFSQSQKYKMIRFFYPLLLVTLLFSGDVAGVSKNDEVSRCCFLFVKILSSQSKHKRLYVIVHHYLSSLL